MCVGIPAEVVERLDEPDLVAALVNGTRRIVNVALLDDEVASGEWVVVHMGFALSKIDEDEAMSAMEFLQGPVPEVASAGDWED